MREIYLNHCEEIIGRVIKINVTSKIVVFNLSFERDDIIIRLPINKLQSNVNVLQELIGKKVAIFRINDSFFTRAPTYPLSILTCERARKNIPMPNDQIC